MSGQSAVHACQAGTDDGADMDVAADIGIMGGRTAAWGRIFAARSESRIRSGLHWFGYYHFFINWGQCRPDGATGGCSVGPAVPADVPDSPPAEMLWRT